MKINEHFKYIGKIAVTLFLTYAVMYAIWYLTKSKITPGKSIVNFVYTLPLMVGVYVAAMTAIAYKDRICEARKKRGLSKAGEAHKEGEDEDTRSDV